MTKKRLYKLILSIKKKNYNNNSHYVYCIVYFHSLPKKIKVIIFFQFMRGGGGVRYF